MRRVASTSWRWACTRNQPRCPKRWTQVRAFAIWTSAKCKQADIQRIIVIEDSQPDRHCAHGNTATMLIEGMCLIIEIGLCWNVLVHKFNQVYGHDFNLTRRCFFVNSGGADEPRHREADWLLNLAMRRSSRWLTDAVVRRNWQCSSRASII